MSTALYSTPPVLTSLSTSYKTRAAVAERSGWLNSAGDRAYAANEAVLIVVGAASHRWTRLSYPSLRRWVRSAIPGIQLRLGERENDRPPRDRSSLLGIRHRGNYPGAQLRRCRSSGGVFQDWACLGHGRWPCAGQSLLR